MTLTWAVRGFEILLGWSVLLQTLEYLRLPALDKLTQWSALSQEIPARPAWLKATLNRVFQPQPYKACLCLRGFLAVALMLGQVGLAGAALLFVMALLLLLPVAQSQIWLLSVLLILLALVLMVFVSRYSPLRKTRPLIYGLGGLAIALELIWHLSLNLWPAVGRALTIPHVIVWLVFLSLAVLRKVKTLTREPF